MQRIYAIDWYPAKNALNLFIKSCGNLKRNTIIRIQELDENGEQIGEDITPSEGEDAIIPSGR